MCTTNTLADQCTQIAGWIAGGRKYDDICGRIQADRQTKRQVNKYLDS